MLTCLLILIMLTACKVVCQSGRLYKFDSSATLPLRGLLALFIVLHHLSQKFVFNPFDGVHLNNYFHFASMGASVVGVFFFISGYGLARSLEKKGKNYINGFLSKRLEKILPEFLTLTILFMIVSIAVGYKSLPDFYMGFANGAPPLPCSWFIYAIIYVYVCFYASALFLKCNPKSTGILLTIFIAMYLLLIVKVLHWPGWWSISILNVVMGYFIALYEPKITNAISSRKGLIAILITVMLIPCVFYLAGIKGIGLLPSYCITILTYVVFRLYQLPRIWPLIRLGELSLYVYLVHYIFILMLPPDTNGFIAFAIVLPASCITAEAIRQIRNFIKEKENVPQHR